MNATAAKKEVSKTEDQPFLMEEPKGLEEGSGRGISTRAEDNLVPLVAVLHFLSPQVEERDPRHLVGAKPGMIWLRNHPTKQLIGGAEGVYWQQCAFYIDWGEWVPRDAGGGLVARYADNNGKPDCATATKDPNNKWKWLNGDNEITQVRNHVGLIWGLGDPTPYVVPFHGAGHSVSRAWMTLTPKRRESDAKADSYDFIWKLTTQFKQNSKGKWFDILPTRVGYASPEQVKLGKQLADSFEAGEKKAAVEDDVPTETVREEAF